MENIHYRIKYVVRNYKVINKATKQLIKNIEWVDELNKEYGVLTDPNDPKSEVVVKGEVKIIPSKKLTRRINSDRRISSRRSIFHERRELEFC